MNIETAWNPTSGQDTWKRLQLKDRNKVKLETRSFNEGEDCEARSNNLPVSYRSLVFSITN